MVIKAANRFSVDFDFREGNIFKLNKMMLSLT